MKTFSCRPPCADTAIPRVNRRADGRVSVRVNTHILAAVILICCLHAPAQINTGGALILERANSNENTYENASGNFISFLRGDVAFRLDDIRISAQEAMWNRNEGVVDFHTDVKVEQRGQIMTCNRLNFRRDRNTLSAIGSVHYSDSAKITFMRGQTAEYATNKKECILYGDPLLTRIDTTETDTLFISGKFMVYNDSLKIATVVDSVKIFRGSLTATGSKGEYFAKENMAKLRVKPVILYEKHRIVGDSVDLFFGKESLESAAVMGNTHGFYSEIADSSSDTTVMNIWSDRLYMAMYESGKVHSIKATGSARGDYTETPADPAKAPAATQISSDSLHMFMFENGKVNAIKAYSRAHARYSEAAAGSKAATVTRVTSDSLHMYMFETGKVNTMKAYGSARARYVETAADEKSTTLTSISSDSMHVFMFETGKISAMKAYGKAHGRSSEWSAASERDSSITHIWSDSLRLAMTTAGKINTMRAFGNVISRNFIAGDSARTNEVSGNRMMLAFNAGGKIERALVRGSAKSRYFVEESDGGGCNAASGDQIIVTFLRGKAQRLRVLGNAKGIYFP
ncbi:MAG: hypothetical protein FWB85_01370 [Chitinispirillia bacterium]|nr:hypothetical protein [Chitinispirillia bacterium]MCL2241361.1 hypothetical protein [Chitinispirillia bacterium]